MSYNLFLQTVYAILKVQRKQFVVYIRYIKYTTLKEVMQL